MPPSVRLSPRPHVSILPVGMHLYPAVPSRCVLARMTPDATTPSLLDEIDARQTELLDELERLNSQIERVLNECLAWHRRDEIPQPAAA